MCAWPTRRSVIEGMKHVLHHLDGLASRMSSANNSACRRPPPPQDQLAFRLGEVKHLKEALRGRDGRITALEDTLRAYELEEGGERTAQETVRQAEGAGVAVGAGCWLAWMADGSGRRGVGAEMHNSQLFDLPSAVHRYRHCAPPPFLRSRAR